MLPYAKNVVQIAFCSLLVLLSVANSASSNEGTGSFELSIVHFSDFHTRFLPITPASELCYDYNKDECVGGVARLATIAKRLKQTRPNALLLNAGDFIQGTLFFDVHQGNATSYFMNKLPHDVMTIGNHDFDAEITGLVSFVKSLEAPVVLANVDCTDEPLLQKVFRNSTVVRKGEKDIGVIGVIFSETDKLSTHTGKLKFLNEVETVNEEAKKLKARGVNIIIVLSHCGVEHDKIMAQNCPDIDVIVGGHSHVLLYNGNPPSKEVAYDKYPIVVKQKSDKKVLIVHSGPFTKYMGDIKVTFDKNDDVASWEGNPIYLDKSIEEDLSILQELKPWKAEVDLIGKQVVGETSVFLNGSCLRGECNLANLVTDAMVDKYSKYASIGITAAFYIQNSIPVGKILYEDLYGAVSFNDTWDMIELKGSDLFEVIEENINSKLGKVPNVNHFILHWSGLKVVYHLSEPHSKVVNVQARCHECIDKMFEDLDRNKWYSIVLTRNLLKPDFKIAGKYRNHVVGHTRDLDDVIEYVQKIKVVNAIEGSRMIFV